MPSLHHFLHSPGQSLCCPNLTTRSFSPRLCASCESLIARLMVIDASCFLYMWKIAAIYQCPRSSCVRCLPLLSSNLATA